MLPSLCCFTGVVVEHVTNMNGPVIKVSMEIQSIVGIGKGKVISVKCFSEKVELRCLGGLPNCTPHLCPILKKLSNSIE